MASHACGKWCCAGGDADSDAGSDSFGSSSAGSDSDGDSEDVPSGLPEGCEPVLYAKVIDVVLQRHLSLLATIVEHVDCGCAGLHQSTSTMQAMVAAQDSTGLCIVHFIIDTLAQQFMPADSISCAKGMHCLTFTVDT